MGDLEFLLLLLLGAAALVRGAAALRVPYPIALVLAGLGIGLVPGLPEVRLEGEVVLLVFLPPLLAAAGFYASPRELRAETGQLAYLAIGLVLATMVAVAVAAHALIDGLSWPAAYVLGAVVAPTDPIAATATFSRMHVPERVALLVEGEAMINDATRSSPFASRSAPPSRARSAPARRRSSSSSPRRGASPSAWPRAGSSARCCASSTTARWRS